MPVWAIKAPVCGWGPQPSPSSDKPLQPHESTDFFISAINQKTHVIFGVVFLLYVFLSFFWSIPYYLIMRFEPGCIYGATHYVEIWIYAFITMATIGEGELAVPAVFSMSAREQKGGLP